MPWSPKAKKLIPYDQGPSDLLILIFTWEIHNRRLKRWYPSPILQEVMHFSAMSLHRMWHDQSLLDISKLQSDLTASPCQECHDALVLLLLVNGRLPKMGHIDLVF